MAYISPVQHLTLLLWILASLVYPGLQGSKETIFRQKRQEGCPIPDDLVWQYRNNLCPTGKKYHCLENEPFIDGCFKPEECISGARPIVEGSKVACRMCPDGTFQPEDHLKTDRTVSSNCRSHSPCNPKYGKKECRAGTTSTDIGCMCDPDRGFSQSHPDRPECDCFTTNDFCNCQETGCANGTTKNAEGLCVPVTKEPKSQETPTPAPSTAAARMTPTGKEDSASLATILTPTLIGVVVVILIIIAVLYCRKHGSCMRKRQKKRDQSTEPLNSCLATGGDKDCATFSISNGNGHLRPTAIRIKSADKVIFQNGPSISHVGSNSKDHRSTPGGRDSVTQQGLTDTYIYVGTEINSEDHTSDEDDNLTRENQNSTRFPQHAFGDAQPESSFMPSAPTSELDTNFEIVPSGAAVSRDEATSHAGDNTVVSTSAPPIQLPSPPEQAPDAGPSAPPDETQHPEPSAPPPSLPYNVDTEADEGDQSESEEDEDHCPLNMQRPSNPGQASKTGPSASPDETPHPEPLAPLTPVFCAVRRVDECGQSESEEDEQRHLLNGSETELKSLKQLQNKETLHEIVLPKADKQLLLKYGDNWAPAAGGLMFV